MLSGAHEDGDAGGEDHEEAAPSDPPVAIDAAAAAQWSPHLVRDGLSAASIGGPVAFPPPTGRNVNMMPIVLGMIHSVPDELLPYASMLAACPVPREDVGKVIEGMGVTRVPLNLPHPVPSPFSSPRLATLLCTSQSSKRMARRSGARACMWRVGTWHL